MCIYWNHRHVCIGNFSIKISYICTCMDVVPAENGHQQAKTSRERYYIMQFYWISGYVVIRGTPSVPVFAEIVQLPIETYRRDIYGREIDNHCYCPFLVGSGPTVWRQSHGRIHSSVFVSKDCFFFVFYLHDQLTIWLSSKFGVGTCSDFLAF